MFADFKGYLSLLIIGVYDEIASKAIGLGDSGNVMDIKVCYGRGYYFTLFVVDGVVEQGDVYPGHWFRHYFF